MRAKRFFSLILALMLCLSMFPVSADGGVVEYDLWIGGTRVTSANAADVLVDGGKVRYNASENTLTLEGADITKEDPGTSDPPSGTQCGIYYGGTDDLTVHLTGDNRVTYNHTGSGYSVCYGFYSSSGVTFKGGGTLTVTVGKEDTEGKYYVGMDLWGRSKIEAGTTIVAEALSANNKTSAGFSHANGDLIVDGNLTGIAGSAQYSTGIISAGLTVNEGAEVTATADSASVSIGLRCQSGTDVDGLTVNGGSVRATGGAAKSTSGDAVGSMSTGILVSGAGDFGIVIKNGSVTANGGESSGTSKNVSSYGIKCNRIFINGGIVEARGGEVRNESGDVQLNALSCGIDSASDMHIGGNAIVTAAGGDAKCSHSLAKGYSVSAGISVYSQYEEPSLTIDGNAIVNASSASEGFDVNSTKRVSRAIFAVNIRIDGGNVTATAENCHYSYGMLCGANDENHITINGGNVKAIGYSQALKKAAVLGSGITAGGSENVDGSNAIMYNPLDNDYYSWFKSPFTAPVTYSLSLSPDSFNFDALSEGYTAPAPVTVTIRNTGTVATGELGIVLEGTNASSFACSPASITNIESGGTAEFTVVPNTGLSEGIYTATVNIIGENGISGVFDVAFRV
ncbi:MAG: hypothetical protein Q4A41_04655, partial [Bacillota bacterium]|nr:hypothetical protein [Bacillota bacterium]